MKKILFFAFVICLLPLGGCLKDDCTSHQTFVRLDPIYKTAVAIRAEFAIGSPSELRNPGKIYVFEKYLLINEINEGIHIFDNSNPANPINLSFITISGNRDMAVKESVLYADNAIDLLAIDIKDVAAPKLLKRINNVFNKSFGWNSSADANSQPILVGYNETTQTQVLDCSQDGFGQGSFIDRNGGIWRNLAFDAVSSQGSGGVAPASSGKASIGVGGSQSRFGIVDPYLYAIDQTDLHVIYIDDPKNPKEGKSVQVAWNVETLFPYKDKLFIGAQSGMYIMDNKNPEAPTLLSTFSHAQACDPVYVDDEVAYITLRDGTKCQTFDNELDIVDIKNITAPRLIKKYPMQNPHGLSIVDKLLFICEGKYGFKIFDKSNINTIDKNLISHLTSFHAYDVIALNAKLLLVVGEDGLMQLDASDPKSVKTISVIPVIKN
ncbi:MAG: hypothetical protein ABI761_14340 [Saprospiraceae bacterium]